MIGPLAGLPPNEAARLASALDTGLLVPPYTATTVAFVIGSTHAAGVAGALASLDAAGSPPRATAAWIRAIATERAQVRPPDLVWSGPDMGAVHGRQTRAVYEELFGSARERLWVSTFVIHNPAGIFDTLARRMDAMPRLAVTLLLNIERRHGDTSAADAIAIRFATEFKRNWPGTRRPDVYYDPRSVDIGDGPGAVLHAKAVVHDNEQLFVTSANLTPKALERNIEAGLLVRDRSLAQALASHFQRLIDTGLVMPLPQVP